MKVFLDVCCLNRPFDDASQLRVAAEALAVERLFALADAGEIELYSSEMARVEIERIADEQRRTKVSALMPPESHILMLSEALLDEAEELVTAGFSLADAVHLAAAARLKVDAFVTTDDRLLRRAKRQARRVGVRATGRVDLVTELEHGVDG
jgi:predicted nucleic acid-binding protein